jgi:hypothetical protein
MAMSATRLRPVPNRLSVLADEARVFLSSARRALVNYKEVGLRLAEAKSLLRHGEWLKWLKREFDRVTPAQAQKYLRLARYWHVIAPALLFDPDLTLSEAVLLPSQQARERKVAAACRRADAAGRQLRPETSGVVCGDFRVAGCRIADESVGLIFTDPPYKKESISLYSDLAQFADRVLAPDSLCITYSGTAFFPQVLEALGRHLYYLGTIAVFMGRHGTAPFYLSHLLGSWKPLLVFTKRPLPTPWRPWWPWRADCIGRPRREKDLHPHQQGLDEAVEIIGHFSRPGSLICDPFLGSGTTGVACRRLGRRFLGFEINAKTARRAAGRIKLAAAAAEAEAGA